MMDPKVFDQLSLTTLATLKGASPRQVTSLFLSWLTEVARPDRVNYAVAGLVQVGVEVRGLDKAVFEWCQEDPEQRLESAASFAGEYWASQKEVFPPLAEQIIARLEKPSPRLQSDEFECLKAAISLYRLNPEFRPGFQSENLKRLLESYERELRAIGNQLGLLKWLQIVLGEAEAQPPVTTLEMTSQMFDHLYDKDLPQLRRADPEQVKQLFLLWLTDLAHKRRQSDNAFFTGCALGNSGISGLDEAVYQWLLEDLDCRLIYAADFARGYWGFQEDVFPPLGAVIIARLGPDKLDESDEEMSCLEAAMVLYRKPLFRGERLKSWLHYYELIYDYSDRQPGLVAAIRRVLYEDRDANDC